MKYIGLFDEKEDIVTKDKLDAVEAAIPTKVSELTNDANYINASQAPVQSINGKTGNVTVSTTFVAYRLGNSSATVTFAEMLEAWKRGDICILRYGADGMLEYQLFAVVDNESITFAYVDGDIIREIVWTADGNFTDNNIEKSTNLSDSSTNSQFPTSKAVWDAIPRPSTTTPLAPTKAGSVGTSAAYARGDHVHPKQTVTKSDVGLGNVDNVSINTRLNRTTNVNASDTNYTTYMARGEALFSTEITPSVNGCIAWVYG